MTDEEKRIQLELGEELAKQAERSDDMDEIRAIAMKMLRILWETDPDPNKQPWPGEEQS